MTVNSTDQNPIGIAPFDVSGIAHLEEFQAAARAMDALVHAMRRDDIPMRQRDWLAAVPRIAAGLPFADNCRTCERAGLHGRELMTFPCSAEFQSDEWLTASYECLRCRSTWSTGWSPDLPDLG
jgi:hypothetical protein